MLSRLAFLIVAGIIATAHTGCLALNYSKDTSAAPEKWEYTTLYSTNIDTDIDDQLAQMGDDGWELMGVDGPRHTFKRPRR